MTPLSRLKQYQQPQVQQPDMTNPAGPGMQMQGWMPGAEAGGGGQGALATNVGGAAGGLDELLKKIRASKMAGGIGDGPAGLAGDVA